jgi:hypothetical protein
VDDDDRSLFEASLRHACESSTGSALDQALEDLGWPEALSVDPRSAVSCLFELQGAANVSSSALDAVIGSALGVKAGPAAGVVLPAPGQWLAPGEIVGGELAVRGVGTAALGTGPAAFVVATSDRGLVALEVATADLTLRSVHGVDPRLGLVEVAGDRLPVTAEYDLASGEWPRAIALARLATGHELVGASRALLELARRHALGRIQFGQPIAAFQAVRHRLADTLVAIEAADAALVSAWDEGSAPAAAMAKALAGRGARTATRHCQQVLAGIGFTAEHDLHRYLRRSLVLDELFGSARALTADLGQAVLATRRLPPLPPL